jgi:amino acid adenylation domain-containing protein/thioester reductase-like protein
MPIIDTAKDLNALFTKQVQITPDAVALEDESSKYTYIELDTRVTALSEQLRLHGTSRDVLVGVLLGRSADYVIACLAALRAGGAFLVLELAYPPDLLADVIEDAKPAVIVTHNALAGRVKAGIPLIKLDEKQATVNGSTKEVPQLQPAEDDLERLAFVSYSSGTTGKPKGIANPHRAPVRSYDLRFELSDLKQGDRVACNVFFIWEILRPLLRGAAVYAISDEISYDPSALVDQLAAKRITETLMTPTLLASCLSNHTTIPLGKRLPELRTLWLNGEVVTTDLARRAMKALPNARLLNVYSCSETHEVACGDIREMLDKDATVCPVGPPMEPEQTYILDEDGQKVDAGTSGELCVGGTLLARGYLNLPETTAKAFVKDPFNPDPEARMYKTGDLAKLLPSGNIEITGRVGAMIKLRGYSIVPGKVEKAIVEQLAVSACAVVARGDGLQRQLIAYVVREKGDTNDRTTLTIDDSGHSPAARRILSDVLAQYMIPALWVELGSLPTHEVSGKIDHKRLPEPLKPRQQAAINGIQNERDLKVSVEVIIELWAATLNTSPGNITHEHNFFDLGGHSLSLADLAARLTRHFGFKVPLARLAGEPTLEGHLEAVKAARDGHTATIQGDLPAVLRADATLPDDLKIPDAKLCPLRDANTILLTGTTGFLGAFLLSDLIDRTTARIICLVRFNNPDDYDRSNGIARIRRNLLDMGLWRDKIMERIELLPGNLSRRRFGLSADAWFELAARVDVIIHAAATVNLVYPYAALRAANVGGTREVIRLACRGGATLQYVSTNGVLPGSDEGWPEDTVLDVKFVPTMIPDGYGQTKWVAEKLVYEAGKKGLPVKIHRPGTISGHSEWGSANAWDLLTAIIVESLQIGHAPDIENWRAEMTPVDFVSKAIIGLSNEVNSNMKIFHLADSDPVPTAKLFEYLAELGYPTKKLPWEDWVSLWTEKRSIAKGGDGGFTVDVLRGGMPEVDFMKEVTVLKDDRTKSVLGLERPRIDKRLMDTYARHWYARGWLPSPPNSHRPDLTDGFYLKGPLSGKVAVITGASSGIGAAVANALSRDGAHVALAARRIEELEVTKSKMAARKGKVIIQKTDVTDRRQVEKLMRRAETELGPIDIVVSCAGVMYWTLMKNAQLDDWDRTVDVNCKGLLHCIASSVPNMLKRSTGHFVAISSDAGRKVFPGLGVYSASKFFVEATLQSLRLETAGSGLRVTSVQPGNTKTPLLNMSTDTEAVKKYGEPSGAEIMDPEDVANAIAYALQQPAHVAMNEILIEPRDEPI